MDRKSRWMRGLAIVGLVAMLIGAIDPLEGSIVIFSGAALVTLAAALFHSRQRRLLYWAFALLAIGVGAMWGMSGLGGVGGSTGRTMWWLLVLLPYPVGWVLGLVGSIRTLREMATPSPSQGWP